MRPSPTEETARLVLALENTRAELIRWSCAQTQHGTRKRAKLKARIRALEAKI